LWESSMSDHQEEEHSDQESDHHQDQVCGDSSQVVAFLSCTIHLVSVPVVIIHMMPRQTMHPPRVGMGMEKGMQQLGQIQRPR